MDFEYAYKFYNSGDLDTTTVELRQSKTRLVSLKMIDIILHETKDRYK